MRFSAVSALSITVLAACVDAPSAAPGISTDPVVYEISFDNRAHHEAEVRVTYTGLSLDPLEVRMSRSSPGRYALHEFGKNVYDVRATAADGRALEVTRPNPHQWDVHGHGGAVTVTYTLYADRADGTYAGIDRTHAHLNMPATFMWARGQERRPIELRISIPEGSGWRIATQLAPAAEPTRFTAPDLQYFLDSPTEVSDHWVHTWDVDGQTVRIALHHAGTEAEASRYAAGAEAIVAAARDIYGELPRFDYGTYTFLACYLPWVSGDGMEHRNSTVLTNTGSLATNMTGVLGTVAHEFFHAWNVERIRPTALEPFDFERENMSGELWFAEGFTSYVDDLILWRAGLISEETFAGRMGGIADAVTNAQGRAYFSPVEMSMQAPFVDAATSLDPNNRQNTFLSYYTWGSGIGMALDLTLRTRFDGVTLDHLMREMWTTHGVTERSYDVDDVEAALGRVTGNTAFAREFFDAYVRGREAPDYPALLGAFGVAVEPARPRGAWLGAPNITFADGAGTVTATPVENSPMYAAGVDSGDRIISIDGRSIATRGALDDVLVPKAPGDNVVIRFESRGAEYTASVVLGADPSIAGRWIPDGTATAEQRARRAAWRQPTP